MRLRRPLPFVASLVSACVVSTSLAGVLLPAVPAQAATARPNAGVARTGHLSTLRATHDPSGTPHIQQAPRSAGRASVVATPLDTANITVTYGAGFNPAARTAFQAAVNIWRQQIVSPVPIHIAADWTPLDTGVLGQAGPVDFRRDFTGAPQAGTYYPDALANALAGHDLDPSQPEIEARFNSAFPSWFLGTSGLPGADRYDFESVVLHELAHGLGFVGSFDGLTPPYWTDSGKGYWGLSYAGDAPTIFDRFAVDGSARAALNTAVYPQGSTALGGLLRGSNGGAQWSGVNGDSANSGNRPRLYSPALFSEGSTFSHLDEATYPAGSPNALMTPYLANNEVEHDPGPIVRGMLLDIGWGLPAETTTPAIGALYQALGGPAGVLGPATSIEFQTDTPGGRFVNYANGVIYWSPATGAHEVHGAIRGKWSALSGETGLLRFPTTNELATWVGGGRYNDFQGGSVYWTSATGAWEVHGAIRDKWLWLGSVAGVLGFPVTDERGTPDGRGRYNHFQWGSVYYLSGIGAHEVHGSIRMLWASLGWEKSRLGYPTSDEYSVSGGRRSNFQHGFITWNSRTGAVTVQYT